MERQVFLPTLVRLVKTYHRFHRYASEHVKGTALTMTQFDILATLGNQEAMTYGELSEKALVTKGTLTGVIERLQDKGLLLTQPNPEDARSQLIRLTTEGQALFDEVFPQHIAHLERAFTQLSAQDLAELASLLAKLNDAFVTVSGEEK